MVVPASFLAVAGLVVVYLFSGRLRFLGGTPRSVWLSVGGGVSVAYVFVHLLPELAESQETIAGAVGEELAFLEYHVYLVSLLGLVFFYGLEQSARGSRGRKAGRGDSTGQGVFWLHISSFAVYNAIIGYLLLHRLDSGLENLLLLSVAMALHFVVNDYGLRAPHGGVREGGAVGDLCRRYTRLGCRPPRRGARPLLPCSLLFGGGTIMNVLKEELPRNVGVVRATAGPVRLDK